MLRPFEAHVLPTVSPIHALVNAIAEAYMATADILPRADPNHIGLIGIYGHTAGTVYILFVEKRLPANPRIFSSPNSS